MRELTKDTDKKKWDIALMDAGQHLRNDMITDAPKGLSDYCAKISHMSKTLHDSLEPDDWPNAQDYIQKASKIRVSLKKNATYYLSRKLPLLARKQAAGVVDRLFEKTPSEYDKVAAQTGNAPGYESPEALLKAITGKRAWRRNKKAMAAIETLAKTVADIKTTEEKARNVHLTHFSQEWKKDNGFDQIKTAAQIAAEKKQRR